MLIEQIFKNKKRQYSYTGGLEGTFQNKLQLKAKPKRKVIKKFGNKKPIMKQKTALV